MPHSGPRTPQEIRDDLLSRPKATEAQALGGYLDSLDYKGFDTELSLTMKAKHWYRLQTLLASLDPLCVGDVRARAIRKVLPKFNRALQRANAAKRQPANET